MNQEQRNFARNKVQDMLQNAKAKLPQVAIEQSDTEDIDEEEKIAVNAVLKDLLGFSRKQLEAALLDRSYSRDTLHGLTLAMVPAIADITKHHQQRRDKRAGADQKINGTIAENSANRRAELSAIANDAENRVMLADGDDAIAILTQLQKDLDKAVK